MVDLGKATPPTMIAKNDCSSLKTVEKLSSLETQQTVQSCDTASTADVVELTDSYRDEYSGSESEEDGYSIKHKKSVLKFINDSSLDELCDIPRLLCYQGYTN